MLALVYLPPADAVVIFELGADGAAGTSGAIGTRGGNGEAASGSATGTDYENLVAAGGGSGGNGGNSQLARGGAGGDGGSGTAFLRSQVPLQPNTGEDGTTPDITVKADVTAGGGQGGNGGSGLIRGNGGAGGTATATGIDDGIDWSNASFDQRVNFAMNVEANGGYGGDGLNGGAGGNGKAVAETGSQPSLATNALYVRAGGGDAGDGVLKGGRGGDADAQAAANFSADPFNSDAQVLAVGGNGGNSTVGLNGDGGHARAVADASGSTGTLSLNLAAQAQGGSSGNPFGKGIGRGGDATAIVDAYSSVENSATFAYTQATALAGDGALRGGDAVARAESLSNFIGDAKALAIGGSGRIAGAALATAQARSTFNPVRADAEAHYTGDFVRQVKVFADAGDRGNDSEVYASASAGSAVGNFAALPSIAGGQTLTATASAPATGKVDSAFAGNDNIASFFADGRVWGLGEFTGKGSDQQGFYYRNYSYTTFTFDTSTIADPQHLWFGFLDSNLGADAVGDFRFSVVSGATTLFDRLFSGADFLTLFDDQLLDLGAWTGLTDASGFLELQVRFDGFAPEVRYAFGQGGNASVPEPAPLMLMLTSLLGLIARRIALVSRMR